MRFYYDKMASLSFRGNLLTSAFPAAWLSPYFTSRFPPPFSWCNYTCIILRKISWNCRFTKLFIWLKLKWCFHSICFFYLEENYFFLVRRKKITRDDIIIQLGWVYFKSVLVAWDLESIGLALVKWSQMMVKYLTLLNTNYFVNYLGVHCQQVFS